VALSMLQAKETFQVTWKDETVYRDNWFDRLAIQYLSQSLQHTTGTTIDQQSCSYSLHLFN
jgi:hypothetical protein